MRRSPLIGLALGFLAVHYLVAPLGVMVGACRSGLWSASRWSGILAVEHAECAATQTRRRLNSYGFAASRALSA